MKSVLGWFIRIVFFLPFVAAHLVLSLLSSSRGDARWGLEHSIDATVRIMFGGKQ